MTDTASRTTSGLLFIDGEFVEGSGGGRFESIDPTTEQVIGEAANGTPEDVDRAIAAARRAADETSWASDLELRLACLEQARRALAAHADELAELVAAEVGAPISTRAGQVDGPIASLGQWADRARGFEWEQELAPNEAGGVRSRRLWRREPWGVASLLLPYNFPIQQLMVKLGPAIAAGNTAVVKPSALTPLTLAAVFRILAEETELPPGVVGLVTSDDDETSRVLASDPRVDLVAFTGSTRVGRIIAGLAAGTVKKVLLELGGKSPTVVLDDADVAGIATREAAGIAIHAGQRCSNRTRLVVPASRYDEAVDAAAAAMAEVRYGDPRDPANSMGPLISARQRRFVLELVDSAADDGGRVVCGGRVPEDLDRGYFVEPTVIAGVGNDARIAREEAFGPVLTILPAADDDDAVRIANDTEYGLAASVWSGSSERALAVARRIRAGVIDVNGSNRGEDAPFGGMKQSGLGREKGVVGLAEYADHKVIGVVSAP